MQNLKTILRLNRCNWCRIPQGCYYSSTTAAAGEISRTEKLEMPPPEALGGPDNPKLTKLVNEISALNLIEVSELSGMLKKKLNLPDASFMPMTGMGMAQVSPTEEEEEEAAPKTVQTAFKVKLMKFDDKQKVALIKEIKNLLEGMNLVQAKKFVESAPAIVKEDIPKDEAEKLKEALTKVGADIVIE